MMLPSLWRYLGLPPDRFAQSLLVLGAILVLCGLVRGILSAEHPRSRIARLPLQALVLCVVLVHAASAHPGRGWINLVVVVGVYALGFLGDEAMRLARRPTERADLGFVWVGALVTVPVGIASALVWG
jgi:hypothetical protein